MIAVELTPEEPVSDVAGYAETAEAAGFDAAFVAHHYNNRDQFAALTAVADATETVDLGPGVANPYETHPVTLASRMATLDEYSGGRGVFGIGPGDASTLANLGVERERPLRRVLETVHVARDLWNGGTVDHDGTFAASDARLNYEPPGSLPVYVGAQGPDMTRMAAKHADGVLFNGAHPRDYAWASDRVAEGLAERAASRGDRREGAGPPEEFDFAAYAPVSVAADAERARSVARYPVAFVVGSAAPPLLERHGIDADLASDVGDAVAAGEFPAAADLVTDPMLDAFCVAGSPEAVAARVDDLLDVADSFVAASPLGPDVDRAIELLGEAVGLTGRSR